MQSTEMRQSELQKRGLKLKKNALKMALLGPEASFSKPWKKQAEKFQCSEKMND